MKTALLFIPLASLLLHLTACDRLSIPETNKELSSDVGELLRLEGMNDAALHVADVFVNYFETWKNNDAKDSIFSSPNGSTLEARLEGVTLSMNKNERNSYPRSILIDFGNEPVTLRDGNQFKGRIIVRQTAPISTVNAVRTYVFSQVEVNDLALNGINTVTQIGYGSQGRPMWKIESKDTLTRLDGGRLSWYAIRIRTRLAKQSTLTPTDIDEYDMDSLRYNPNQSLVVPSSLRAMMRWDNRYSVYGACHGFNGRGKAYSLEFLEGSSLTIGDGFPYYTGGKALYSLDGDVLAIDFGEQKKDYLATTTLYGLSMDYNFLDHFSH